MVKNIVVLGMQWGDEGKGKIVDLLSPYVHYVVRYQGGHNAGHTILVNQKKIVLHVVPSGVLHNHIINIIGNGAVLSPNTLIKEIELLKELGISLHERIFISASCPLIFPYHIAMDRAREKFLGNVCNFMTTTTESGDSIGTTGCGIGPVYEDKVARRALRVGDLCNEKNFEEKLKSVMDYYNFQLVHYYYEQSVSYNMVYDQVRSISNKIIDMIADIPKILKVSKNKGNSIIFEGAQGSLLDIDHGTYPYVTSSNTVSGSASIGSGIGPRDIDHILGVVKAYCTRVGFGPFPTELLDNTGKWLYEHGDEFGSTTGRRRRTGWFDAVAVRYAIQISSVFSCCITKLDVLDGLKEIKICVAYRQNNGKVINNFPSLLEDLEHVTPVYEILPGWKESTSGITIFNQLPKRSQCYIKRIEEIIGIPVDIVSTGPQRESTIILCNPFL